jgi:hypothetical protein
MAQAVAASRSVKSADDRPVSPLARPEKITFAEMREQGVRGVLVDRADCHCSHCVAISGQPEYHTRKSRQGWRKIEKSPCKISTPASEIGPEMSPTFLSAARTLHSHWHP